MTQSPEKTHTPPPTDPAAYPELRSLLLSYLNQDYEYISEDLDEVLLTYKRHTPADRLRTVLAELNRFLSAHLADTDEAFTQAFDNLLHPEIDFNDWDGRTTKQSVQHIIALLSADDTPTGLARP